MKLCPDLAWQRLDDGMVLLDSRRGRYFELNATAARMFELIAEGLDEAAIAGRIADEYEIDLQTASRDLREVIDTLRERRFLDC